MFDKNAIKIGFDKSSLSYENNAKLQEKIRHKAIIIANEVFPKQAAILDIGCGSVLFPNDTVHVIGLDFSYGMCKMVRSKNNLVINADAHNIPLKDNSFEGVFSSLFLQWSDSPEVIIKEILRVLKPDGTAVITTFTHGTLQELEQAFLAADSSPHISKFIDSAQLLLKIAHHGGLVLEFEEDIYKEYFDDLISLMRSIKNIGASNKLKNRRKGLMTANALAKVQDAYKKENGKFLVSWNVLTVVIGKA